MSQTTSSSQPRSAVPGGPTTGFAALSPFVKIGLWAVAVGVLAGAIQGVVWLSGSDWSILAESGGSRGLLLTIALGCLLVLMAVDRQPASTYGFFVGRAWSRLLFGGFGLGLAAYGGYCALAVAVGACSVQTELLRPGRALVVGLVALDALVVGLVQQIIFSGYLLGVLRPRYGRAVAVLVPALMFAVLYRLGNPAALLSAEALPLSVGLFLVAALLGMLRLKTGSILLPAGFLAGCIYVRRVVRKLGLLVPAVGSPSVAWWVPQNDPRQAPALWVLLCAGVAVCWYLVHRRGEGRIPESQPAWDKDFKRVFPLSNGSMLAPLDVWLPRLWKARFRIGLKYLPRLAAVLCFSAFNTLLSLPERVILAITLRRRVPDPVFIVGVHRSGTTHLHNLLALDPQFCTPRAYQIMNPAGFNFSGWLITPLIGVFLPWKRPMDSVRFHIFAPQEEEFALAGMSGLSPYWGITFPRDGAGYDRFIFPENFTPRELAAWQRTYLFFLRKLTLLSPRRPLLKNPYNTARVGALAEMFPRARFIHIHRHPYAVYRSNMHTAAEGHIISQLQDPDPADNYQTRFLDNYRRMEDAFYRDAALLPDDQVVEVRFEDLERDPLGELRKVYSRLGLQFTPEYERRVERYLASIAGYQKNRFRPLPDEVRRAVDQAMGAYFARWGYDTQQTESVPAESAPADAVDKSHPEGEQGGSNARHAA